MQTTTIILIVAIWFIIGASGFIYWFTKDHDYTVGDIPFTIAIAIMGPLTWPMGWLIHGEDLPTPKTKTIIKQRKPNN